MRSFSAFKVICLLCFLAPFSASASLSLIVVIPLFCCFMGAIVSLFLNRDLMPGMGWFGLFFVAGVVSGNLVRILFLIF